MSKKADTTLNSFADLEDALDLATDDCQDDTSTIDGLGEAELVLPGDIFSVIIHDPAFAQDTYSVTKLMQILANGYQGAKVAAEDIIESIEAQAKKNLEEGRIGQSGEPEVMTPNQEMLVEKLEDSLDMISYIYTDLKTNFEKHNDNPENKLFYTADVERRANKRKFAAERNEKQMKAQKELLEHAKQQRELRRQARATRAA